MNEHFLTEIEIKQFKCFTDFKASGFKRVNLIGGKNNIGKTALMEACYINVHAQDINTLITAIVDIKFMRENANLVLENEVNYKKLLDNTQNYLANSNLKNTCFSIFQQDGLKQYRFTIDNTEKSINANDVFISLYFIENINFINNFGWSNKKLAKAFQAIQKQDKETELISFLQGFDKNITNFKVIGGKAQCKVAGEYHDIAEFGDGLNRYISIICALYECKNGYLFIDEIENGIYFFQFAKLWEIILTVSKEINCQVFVTTHSKEIVASFAKTVKNLDETEVSFITLFKNKKDESKAITRDCEMLLNSIDAEREVR
jgi:AAA15 family ATPase/GTPase